MNYLLVDDEPIILLGMEMSLREVVGKEPGIYTAEDSYAAIELAKAHPIDIMFTDVDMPGMNGLQLSEKIHEISEETDIIFVTGYAHYSLDAWKTAAQAFVLKPVGEDELRSVLMKVEHERMRRRPRTENATGQSPQKDVTARCFGNFELSYRGRPIHFARKKSKEMLAYLIDRRGAMITTDEIRSILWEEDEDTDKKRGYVRVLANDIRKSFEALRMENILINDQNSYCVDVSKIACDYYDFLDGKENAKKIFQDEYMSQYSWAEATLGRLIHMK